MIPVTWIILYCRQNKAEASLEYEFKEEIQGEEERRAGIIEEEWSCILYKVRKIIF